MIFNQDKLYCKKGSKNKCGDTNICASADH